MKIAEAFVEITAKLDKLKVAMRGIKGMVMSTMIPVGGSIVGAFSSAFSKVGSVIRNVLGGILGFITRWAKRIALVISGAIAAGVVLSIREASNAEQIRSRFNIVFGALRKDAEKFAEDLARSVGRSKTDIQDSLSNFQSFFTGLGLGGSQSARLSKALSQLAIDFGSFVNISDQEASNRFISALSGSVEVLDKFGINLKQAAIDQKLLELGFQKSTQGATEQQKVLARTMLIFEAMGRQGAIGNASQTIDEFANRLKEFKSEVRELAVAIGNTLLGSGGGILGGIIPKIRELRNFITANMQNIQENIRRVLDFVMSVWNASFSFMVELVTKLIDKIRVAIEAIRSFIEFDQLGGSPFEKFIAATQIAFSKVKVIIVNALDDAVSSALSNMFSQLSAAFDKFGLSHPAGVFGAFGGKFSAESGIRQRDRMEDLAKEIGETIAETNRESTVEDEVARRVRERLALPEDRPDTPTLPNLSDIVASLGAGAARATGGLITAVQSAIGEFKFGQQVDIQKRQLDVLENIEDAVEDTNEILEHADFGGAAFT